MTYTGIKFNGLHSYRDLNLTIAEHNIGNPPKIKRRERVPYSNQFYDFSNLYGSQEYGPRQLMFVFNIVDSPRRDFYTFETQVTNWLMQVSEFSVLKYDLVKGYYFLAEVDESIDTGYSIDYNWGTLTVNFTAYPFKIGELEEGHDIWDEFNFLLDYAQITDFEINGTKEVTLYNNGASIIKPIIKTTAPFEISKDGKIFNIPVGESESYDFLLFQGENKMTIKGNGKISFHFRKELI